MEAYISMISAFGCNFVIRNWGACSGGLLAINQNTTLYSLIQNFYGGDGRTSFALPDLRSRVPISYGHGPGLSNKALGQIGGRETTTLTVIDLPSHHHSISVTGTTQQAATAMPVSTDAAGTTSPDGNYLGATSLANLVYTGTLSSPAGAMGPIPIPAQQLAVTGMTGASGGSQPVHTQSPYQAVNFQMCMFGIYPSRA